MSSTSPSKYLPLTRTSEIPHLAFVTDGQLYQVIGIAIIINSLLRYAHPIVYRNPIWIVTPQSVVNKTSDYLLAGCGPLDFRFLVGESRLDDKYYIQLGVTEVFEQVDAEDLVLYLDYDHVVLDPAKFTYFSKKSAVEVSSEVNQRTLIELRDHINKGENNTDLPSRHLNTSLIYGQASELQKIGSHWVKAYNDLALLVPIRNRTELAFTLAAELARVTVLPCDSVIQANFAEPNSACCVFHYGGDSSSALFMKNLLITLSDKLTSNLTHDDVAYIATELINALTSILSPE